MNSLRRFAAAILASFCVALPVSATTFSTDYTDLWYLPAEDGWGVNVVQQAEVVFATLFVYGADNSPRWFVAPNTGAFAAPAGQNIFSGPLYTVTGTYYGVPWAGRTPTQVGNITFTFNSPTTGTVGYTVNGVSVTRSIVRQTWRATVLTGNYVGGMVGQGTGCGAGNDGAVIINGELSVNHSNPNTPIFRIDFFAANGQPGVCTYTGTYGQEGKMGRVIGGTFSCAIENTANAPAGSFTLSQVQASTNGMTARYSGSDQFCTNYTGFFGGIKDVF
jgi:hypothetical protein